MDKIFNPETMTISSKYLDDLISFHSSKTVGKILKRFELTDNKDVIKTQVKELLYESFRDFKDMIVSANYGREYSIFQLKSKENENGKSGKE